MSNPTFSNTGGTVPVIDVTITSTGQKVTINQSDYNPSIHSSPSASRRPQAGVQQWNTLPAGGGTYTLRVTKISDGSYLDIQSNQYDPTQHKNPRFATLGVQTFAKNPNPGFSDLINDPNCTYEGQQPVDEGTPLLANYVVGQWWQYIGPISPVIKPGWVLTPAASQPGATPAYMPGTVWLLKSGGTATHAYDSNGQFSLISNGPHDFYIPWDSNLSLPYTAPTNAINP